MTRREWPVRFINRHDELETLKTHIRDWGTRKLVFVNGPGGIGKTRLLDELERQFSEIGHEQPVRFIPIIDLDDDRYKFSQNIGFAIASQLDRDAFLDYFDASRDLREAEERGVDTGSPILKRKSLAINRTFVQAFNDVAHDQRLILRFDTTDALGKDSTTLAYLFGIAHELKNTLIILAGRNAKDLHDKLGHDLGPDGIDLPLRPFGTTECREYLEAKQLLLGVRFNLEWLEKLFVVTGGVPILIDLAIQWAQTHRKLEWLDEFSREELEDIGKRALAGDAVAVQEFESIRHQFEREIVMPIARLELGLDYLQFLLAKVYPLDLEGIIELLNLDRGDALVLMEQAYNSVAIKQLPDGRIKLHDEIQRLVAEHVWSLKDRDNSWEQRDSRRAIGYLAKRSDTILQLIQSVKERAKNVREYYDPIETLELYVEQAQRETEFWSLRIERLRRQMALDVVDGYALFNNDYGLAHAQVANPSARDGILDAMERYAWLEAPESDLNGRTLTLDQRVFLLQEKAKQSIYSGSFAEAERMFDQLLHYADEDSETAVVLLKGMADAQFKRGNFNAALSTNQKALKLAQAYPDRKVKVLIDAGWFSRQRGFLDQAVKHYSEALELAIEQNDEENIALISQNQAYVLAIQHNERMAMDKVSIAIRKWQKLLGKGLDLSFRLGQAYNIAGEISLEFERPNEALALFELSGNIFLREEFGRAIWRAKSRSGYGFAHWQLAVVARKKNDMQVAENHLALAEESLGWAADNAGDIDAPQILNRLAEVYYLQGSWHAAREKWYESMETARQIGDAFSELHSMGDLARLAFYHPTAGYATGHDFEQHYNDYKSRYRTYFAVLDGLIYTYLGHLALRDQLIDDAVEWYRRGLPVLSSYATYDPFNFVSQLQFIEREIIPKVPVELAYSFGDELQHILDEWKATDGDPTPLSYLRELAVEAHASR